MHPLNALINEVKRCTLCAPYLTDGVRPVFSVNASARILVAGQAPGRKVHETGIPFNDPSGERLRDWMGIEHDVFYDANNIAILPMGFCYPGTGKSGDLPPRPECATAWRERLLTQLPKVEMTLVIGQYAQRYHLHNGKQSVTDTVRAWESYWPRYVPLPHPSPRNNIWLKKNPWFEHEVIPRLREQVKRILSP